MIKALERRYYSHTLAADVATLHKECDVCDRAKHGRSARQVIRPLEIVRPGYRYHIDHVVMAKPSNEGHTGVLVLRDAGSRFSLFAATFKFDATSSTKQLVDWFNVISPPAELTADSEFLTSILGEICDQLRIHKHIVTPYHHNGNGVVERVIAQVHQHFRICNAGNDWHLFVSSLHPAVNDRWMRSIGTTPFHMFYNRHFLFGADTQAISQSLARVNEKEWRDSAETVRSHSAAQMLREQAIQRDAYARKHGRGHISRILRQDDQVLVLNDQSIRGHKDMDIYHGPYTVTDVAYDSLSATVLIDGSSRTFPVEELKLSRQARPSQHHNTIATPTLDGQSVDTDTIGVAAPSRTSGSRAIVDEPIAPPAAPTPPKKRRNEFAYERIIGC
jgi:hypothetical protein